MASQKGGHVLKKGGKGGGPRTTVDDGSASGVRNPAEGLQGVCHERVVELRGVTLRTLSGEIDHTVGTNVMIDQSTTEKREIL